MSEHHCQMCGSEEDLVEDPNMEGFYFCQVCLDRVAQQNQSIDDGMDEEPPVEY